jgi:hypothetical protein
MECISLISFVVTLTTLPVLQLYIHTCFLDDKMMILAIYPRRHTVYTYSGMLVKPLHGVDLTVDIPIGD